MNKKRDKPQPWILQTLTSQSCFDFHQLWCILDFVQLVVRHLIFMMMTAHGVEPERQQKRTLAPSPVSLPKKGKS